MTKMIQVRDVPDRLHRELVRRARKRGLTLTDYVERVLEREVARPAAAEVFDRIEAREPVTLGGPASDLVHDERDAREAT